MDFHLKQWSADQNRQEESEKLSNSNHHHHPPPFTTFPPSKIPRLRSQDDDATIEIKVKRERDDDDQQNPNPALPLFVSESASQQQNTFSSPKLANYLPSPACYSDDSASRFAYGGGGGGGSGNSGGNSGGGYFSMIQWQELELQAVIFRHMAAGATVPAELLHLVKRSLIANSPSLYLRNYSHYPYQQHQSPHMQGGGVTVGYWGNRGNAMDAEPGRCRRTDGKKWRCSRDVMIPGQKYCERHVHRGRNRSRKPVEFSSSPLSNTVTVSSSTATEPVGIVGFARDDVGGGSALFRGGGSFNAAASASSQLDQRMLSSNPDRKFLSQNEQSTTRTDSNNKSTLRHFFNDWPGSTTIQQDTLTTAASTSLSISTPGRNPSPSSTSSSLDFLKLSTGDDDQTTAVVDDGHEDNQHQQQRRQQQLMNQLNWNRMGGPLGEALRSSTTTTTGSSPTSVLHHQQQLPTSVSETSYASAA